LLEPSTPNPRNSHSPLKPKPNQSSPPNITD
jgi:hypothetical protein